MGVKILDREVRNAFRRLQAMDSKWPSTPPVKSCLNRKDRTKMDPFHYSGIDENGSTHTWAPLSDSTAQQKARDRGVKGATVYDREAGRWRLTALGQRFKTTDILVKTGSLRNGLRVGVNKKKDKAELFVGASGDSAGGGKKSYAYMHLHGAAGKYPARPWAVWTQKEVAQFSNDLEVYVAKEIKK